MPALLFWVLFLSALAIVGWWLTARIRQFSLANGVLDTPNHRSSHRHSVPRGGGMSIVLCLFAGITVLQLLEVVGPSLWLSVLLGGGMVAAVSWRDDKNSMPAARRIQVHLMAAAASVAILTGGTESALIVNWLPGWMNWLVAMVGLVWLLNLYNFMDGIDGLAAVEALSFGGFLIAVGILLNSSAQFIGWVVIASVVGFAIWNWPPAKIFMGDVGSAFLGIVLGSVALAAIDLWSIPLPASLIMLGAFVVDATVTLGVRVFTGQRWYQAHRSHAYQHAARRYGSHAKVTVAVLLVNVFWLLPVSLLAVRLPAYSWYLLLFAYTPLLLVAIRFNAGTPDESVQTS